MHGREVQPLRYGITADDYKAMLDAQGGACAICGSDDPKNGGRPSNEGHTFGNNTFHIDHDHDTDQVRGLLCSLCNRMLGQGQDSSRILQAGAAYLQRFGR